MTVNEALHDSINYRYQDSAIVKTLSAEVIRLREALESLRDIRPFPGETNVIFADNVNEIAREALEAKQ